MSLFFHLLLTHFVADYPLQSGWMIRLKRRGYVGVLLHCLVHLAVMLALLFPLLHLPQVWVGIGIVFGTHNGIDQTKMLLDRRYPQRRRLFYFLDQLAHILVVFGVSVFLRGVWPQAEWAQSLYGNRLLLAYLLCLVLSTYFYDVTRYFLRLSQGSAEYRRDYRTMGRNALLVTAAFGLASLI